MDSNNIVRESGENYLEIILVLEDEKGEVRSIDVANRLNVSRPSVNKAINNLKECGMVEQQYYGSIRLTDKGREKARKVMKRHVAIKTFLTKILGVSEETAERDACLFEHDISEETFDCILDYLTRSINI